MSTGDSDASRDSSEHDQAVHLYLQALELSRAAPENYLDPDRAGPALAGADMVTGDDREGLGVQLAESTPGSQPNKAKLENDFVEAAPGYSRRHGMTYEGWRQAGVDSEVLARAGIRARTE